MFKDNFYTLLEVSTDTKNTHYCKVKFNSTHTIYKSHFQGFPITPGACIIQITKELIEIITQKSLLIKEIKNLKFLNIINPNDFPEVTFQFALTFDETKKIYLSKVNIYADDITFAKLNLILSLSAL